ncbi:MAG TPA: hypothetical protein VHW44_06140 [Pseudonocardiaceae bacterium]|nr:hypothetical protein [Pseudonocardiaceae bacterium]
MSWSDFYQRRDAIDLVLAQAGQHPDAGLPQVGTPTGATTDMTCFTSREDLALALQYRWSLVLQGQLAVALTNAERTPHADSVDAVTSAWRTAAAAQPQLRALLDNYAAEAGTGPVFRARQHAEWRLLALAAGLAEVGEPAEETARIGAAFQRLINTAPPATTGRRRHFPMQRFYRRMAASS